MSAKHTPAPWLIAEQDPWTDNDGNVVQHGRFSISAGSTDQKHESYYFIGSVSNVNNSETNAANARLISAAPELLEALQELHTLVWGECPSLLDEDSGGNAALDMAICDAISKATGGEQ